MKIIRKSTFVKLFNLGVLKVSSGSMMPHLNIGEIIIILEKNTYEIGDIITFYTKNENLLTHRIVGSDNDGFITKGDFNNVQDEEIVKKQNIQGKVIFHSKILGIIFRYNIIFIFLLFIKKYKRSCYEKSKTK